MANLKEKLSFKKTNKISPKEEIKNLIKRGPGASAVKMFDQILIYSHVQRASDIHIEPWKGKAIVRIRVDGMLRDEFVFSTELNQQLIARIKILTRMRTDEHQAPQDGRFKFITPTGDVDVRVSVIPTSQGEKAVLRLLSSASHKLSLEQLGFSPKDLVKVQKVIKKPWGMILATGPTGSGKTTTVYGILEILNSRTVNISTIEDPVEFEIEGVNQSQVNTATEFTFASGLRSLLRQDPDIIMVGEIRDQVTAQIAVNAGMTGHKMLSTLHTNDASTTIPRLIDLGAEPFLVSSTLLCAIAQRLVRKVCADCHQKVKLSRKQAATILPPDLMTELFGATKRSVTIAQAKGCKKCDGSGYKGRIGIFEVLENTPAMQEMISKRAESHQIKQVAIKEGMTTMLQDAALKISNCSTTLEEILLTMQED